MPLKLSVSLFGYGWLFPLSESKYSLSLFNGFADLHKGTSQAKFPFWLTFCGLSSCRYHLLSIGAAIPRISLALESQGIYKYNTRPFTGKLSLGGPLGMTFYRREVMAVMWAGRVPDVYV